MCFVAHGAERRESSSQALQFSRAQAALELGVDGFNSCAHYARGSGASFGDADHHAATVVGIRLAFEIAAQDQRIDQLSGGLLGNAQSVDKVAWRTAVIDQAAQDEGAIAGHIFEACGGEPTADFLGVNAPRGAQQRGKDDLIGKRGWSHASSLRPIRWYSQLY